jgi:hypothetical protein
VSFDFVTELLTKCFIDFDGHHKNFAMLCNALVLFPVLRVFKFLNSSGHQVYLLACMLIVMMVRYYSYEDLSFQHFVWCPLA